MTDAQTGARLPDEEALNNEISDQALERACYFNATAVSTLIVSSYCFTCAKEGALGFNVFFDHQ
jgi:hypothetical protein